MIFCVSVYVILTTFCEKLKVTSSVFSLIKNIVAPSVLSSLPIKLVCCIVSASSNSVCLNLLQLVCNYMKNNQYLINYL